MRELYETKPELHKQVLEAFSMEEIDKTYRFGEDILGLGFFGQVVLGYHKSNRKVAIKEIPMFHRIPKGRPPVYFKLDETAINEVFVLRLLNHPNVV